MSAEETSPYPGPVDTFIKVNPEATGPLTYADSLARARGEVAVEEAPVEAPVEEAPAEEAPVVEEAPVEEAPAPKKKAASRRKAED